MKYNRTTVTQEKLAPIDIPDSEFKEMVKRDYEFRLKEAADKHLSIVITPRTPKEIFDSLDREILNNDRKHHRDGRSQGRPKMAYLEDGDAPIYVEEVEAIADSMDDYWSSVSTSGHPSIFELREAFLHEEKISRDLKEILKPDAYDMVIKIALDGVKPAVYAQEIGDKPNNVSKRYRRALKLVLKYLMTQAPEQVEHWKK